MSGLSGLMSARDLYMEQGVRVASTAMQYVILCNAYNAMRCIAFESTLHCTWVQQKALYCIEPTKIHSTELPTLMEYNAFESTEMYFTALYSWVHIVLYSRVQGKLLSSEVH